jgi:hypothetical protein
MLGLPVSETQVLELQRQIAEAERRIARIGDPTSREELLLVFSLEREVKEWRRRLSRADLQRVVCPETP